MASLLGFLGALGNTVTGEDSNFLSRLNDAAEPVAAAQRQQAMREQEMPSKLAQLVQSTQDPEKLLQGAAGIDPQYLPILAEMMMKKPQIDLENRLKNAQISKLGNEMRTAGLPEGFMWDKGKAVKIPGIDTIKPPVTTGLPEGQQWSLDPTTGTPIAIKIPGSVTKEDMEQKGKMQGKEQLDAILSEMSSLYDTLHEKGAIADTSKGNQYNALTRLQSSEDLLKLPEWAGSGTLIPGGQNFGRTFATEEQSVRDQISAKAPLLTQAIKTATGMSAQQMNSDAELQNFLKALGGVRGTLQSNKKILSDLSKLYGTGKVSAEIKPTKAEIEAELAARKKK